MTIVKFDRLVINMSVKHGGARHFPSQVFRAAVGPAQLPIQRLQGFFLRSKSAGARS